MNKKLLVINWESLRHPNADGDYRSPEDMSLSYSIRAIRGLAKNKEVALIATSNKNHGWIESELNYFSAITQAYWRLLICPDDGHTLWDYRPIAGRYQRKVTYNGLPIFLPPKKGMLQYAERLLSSYGEDNWEEKVLIGNTQDDETLALNAKWTFKDIYGVIVQ